MSKVKRDPDPPTLLRSQNSKFEFFVIKLEFTKKKLKKLCFMGYHLLDTKNKV